MTDDFKVELRHLRPAGKCIRGSIAFCKRHDIDWKDFTRNGIPAKRLIDTGDAMALHLVEVARGGR